ncbi:MAG: hypothetical protein N2037_10760, partial [Acidimicrobiales bacterium]|nr:hypothetical protein [Acidimicrobiales bacterium]
LSSSDAITALRSFPRRYRAEILPALEVPTAEESAYRAGPNGESAMEIFDHTTRTLHMLARALHQVMVSQDTAVLHPGVLDPAQRQFTQPDTSHELTIEEALDQFADACEEMAQEIERVHFGDWSKRKARIADGREIDPFEIVTEAVRAGATGLTRIREALAVP